MSASIEDSLARVDRAAEALEPNLIALARELIACRTDSQSADNPEFPGEALRCQEIIAGRMLQLGMEVERWVEPPHYPVVVGRIPGSGGGRSLAFNGHVDVVPVGDNAAWQHDPWAGEISDGRLWGRGAADMKGGVAACLTAIQAIVESGVDHAGDIWMHVVADEEVVGFSTRNLAARLPNVDAVIVAEPTDLRVMPAEGGLVHFRIEFEGRESHAGNRYMSARAGGPGDAGGVNAVEKAMKVAAGLQDLERHWAATRSHPMLPAGFNTILPGIIMGGPGGGRDGQLRLISNPGTTPNYCSIEYNLWWLPQERYEDIVREIEAYVASICEADPWLRAHPPRFTWKLRNIWFPPANTAPDHPFIDVLGDAVRRTGLSVGIEGFTAASELAWYAEHGIVGSIFGPGRIAQAHSPNEYVEISQLILAARTMAMTAAAWCA